MLPMFASVEREACYGRPVVPNHPQYLQASQLVEKIMGINKRRNFWICLMRKKNCGFQTKYPPPPPMFCHYCYYLLICWGLFSSCICCPTLPSFSLSIFPPLSSILIIVHHFGTIFPNISMAWLYLLMPALRTSQRYKFTQAILARPPPPLVLVWRVRRKSYP